MLKFITGDNFWICNACLHSNHQSRWFTCEVCSSVKHSAPTQTKDTRLTHGIHNYLCAYSPNSLLVEPFPVFSTQRGLVGSGWTCGYRNIQMMLSSLVQINEYKNILFDGRGNIPGILEIQRHIEQSWKDGFDPEGAQFFSHSLFGKDSWIGATECAALFRYFGLKAVVVEFPRKESQVKVDDELLVNITSSDGVPELTVKERIAIWLRRYFLENGQTTQRFPLFFQHMGHSRSIVGINVKDPLEDCPTMDRITDAIVFDPMVDGSDIMEAFTNEKLLSQERWRPLLQHDISASFNHSCYQIVYIAPGLMTEEERKRSKIIKGERYNTPLNRL